MFRYLDSALRIVFNMQLMTFLSLVNTCLFNRFRCYETSLHEGLSVSPPVILSVGSLCLFTDSYNAFFGI